jgi:CBS domain-containing protein
MRVQDIMTEGVQTTTANTDAEAAWQLMKQKAIRHLVVVDGGQPVGVLSTRDMGGPRGSTLRNGLTVADLMSSGLVAVEASTTVRQAANVMRGRSIGSLVVTAKDRPVGIITVSDLLDLLGRGVGREAAPQRPVTRYRVPHRKRHTAAGAW